MPSAPKPPQLNTLHLDDLADGRPEEVGPGATLTGRSLAIDHRSPVDLTDARLDGVRFDRFVAPELRLRGAGLLEVALDAVDVPVVDAARTDWSDARLSGRVGALTAYDSSLRSVHFTGCRLGFVNLRGAELLDVQFTDCSIDELDLSETRCRRVQFTDTRIASLELPRASLTDMDLRGAALSAVSGIGHLSGATISHEQALQLTPLLAAHVGISISDE
ncbi:pentapeptide repeat-containing protein [Microbacterium binotii]|uniref:pentapeptide repeat-containing protein n=1 Tax=Microbacterium binotii TaxID=462710 RepID=UPI001F3CED92|nr:pentapeptide repeat-containing protein [Microbacterium binotii]UIN29295.1 pentapeptide repeat-containing protein [Microbacterium binotii]